MRQGKKDRKKCEKQKGKKKVKQEGWRGTGSVLVKNRETNRGTTGSLNC